jgi:predicted acetyltransferase
MNVKLIKLTREYKNELGEMIDEWKYDQKVNHTNRSPYAIFKNDYHDIDYYLDNLDFMVPTDGHVPTTTFFLLDVDRNRLLGAVNIRHYVNYSVIELQSIDYVMLPSLLRAVPTQYCYLYRLHRYIYNSRIR